MNNERVEMIRTTLQSALAPQDLEIEDVSHEHAGHEGARSGGGHFNVLVVSEHFQGVMALKRHRMIYDALGDAMRHDIHALSIRAYTPEEF
jgi:BolA protein